jgi:hypothetical protein
VISQDGEVARMCLSVMRWQNEAGNRGRDQREIGVTKDEVTGVDDDVGVFGLKHPHQLVEVEGTTRPLAEMKV